MGSYKGVLKIAAGRLGLTLNEYMAHINAGEKWCMKCKMWQPVNDFGDDKTRGDGKNATCTPCRRVPPKPPKPVKEPKPPRVKKETAPKIPRPPRPPKPDPKPRDYSYMQTPEYRKKMSEALKGKTKGRPSVFKGKTHSPEAKQKMSRSQKGNQNRKGKPFTPEQLAYLTAQTRANAHRGPQVKLWKGGVTPEHRRIRQSAEYRDWRKAVFERDGYTCQKCSDSRGGNLNAHHIKSFANHSELRFEISNGITLCEQCHDLTHTGKPRIRRNA